uniref:Uncharacterized protein n=1 Tax=Romanomermis culicivorax TaxID=13658 RepID=A0A915L6T5_ROMCU
MTATVRKPNNLTLQAVIAANTNAMTMHRRTAPKESKRVSPLQWDAEIQKRLEALKNPPKAVFKVPLPPPPPMDVEQATSASTLLPPTAMSQLPTAPTSATTTTPPWCSHFHGRSHLRDECFAGLVPIFCDHYCPTYQEQQLPVSHGIAALILRWVTGLWAEELGLVDAVHTAHLALFLYKAGGLPPDCPSLIATQLLPRGVNPLSPLRSQTYTSSSRRRDTTYYGHNCHSRSVCFDGHDNPCDTHGYHNDRYHQENHNVTTRFG